MVMRPMMVRRRPLLRAAAVGGTFAAGRAMGRRSQEQAQEQAYTQADQAQAAQVPAAQASADPGTQPPGGSMMDQLNQLTAMHEQGALSDEEFAAAKAKILGS